MRKTIIKPETTNPRQNAQDEWLDLEKVATVEITSEDPKFPIESALATREGPGWRAAERGQQVIRLRSAQGKLIASLMAALAEFERDLLRERVRSGIAAARKRAWYSAGGPASGRRALAFLPPPALKKSALNSPLPQSVVGE